MTDYLVASQLVSTRQILEEGISLHSTNRQRATSTIVRIGDNPVLRVKTAHTDKLAPLQREISCYQLISQQQANVCSIPTFVHSNEERSLLITENLSPGMTMHEVLSSAPERKAELLIHVACSLAEFHSVFGTCGGGCAGTGATQTIENNASVNGTALSAEPPWVLADLETVSTSRLVNENHFWSFVNQHAALELLLGMARMSARQWHSHCLIHGDVKWDNVVLRSPGTNTKTNDKPIALVDWELGGWGDSAWDIGTVIQELLLDESQMSSSEIAQDTIKYVTQFLMQYHVIIDHSTDSESDGCTYECDMAGNDSGSLAWLRRVVLYSGVRLMQSAYEFQAVENGVGIRTRHALSLAEEIASSPELFASKLGLYSCGKD